MIANETDGNDHFESMHHLPGSDIVQRIVKDWPLSIDISDLPPESDAFVQVQTWGDVSQYEQSFDTWLPRDAHYQARLIMCRNILEFMNQSTTYTVGRDSRVSYEMMLAQPQRIQDKGIIQSLTFHPDDVISRDIAMLRLERVINSRDGISTKGIMRVSVSQKSLYERLHIPDELMKRDDLFLICTPDGRGTLEDTNSSVLWEITPQSMNASGFVFSVRETDHAIYVSVAIDAKSIQLKMGNRVREGFVKRMFGENTAPITDVGIAVSNIPKAMLS